MKTKLIQMCVLAACAAFEGWAMPSEEEVEKAVPKVERMLSSEKVALESGKMKRGEVAAAAMKLASGVNDEAAKLLLMKGAFVLHVKDGNLEKAVETMNALETAIADMPPQVVTNIIETALLGLPDKNDGARLYRLLDAGKVSPRVGFGEGKNMKAVVNGYTWSYSVRNGEATIVSPSGKSGECAISPKPTGDVTIPSTLGGAKVTSIGNSAFAYCREMKSVMIPNSVTNIGFWAFYQCWRLPSVIIPEGVISIQELAFEDCWHGLTSVTIPSTVTNIGWCAFAGNGGKLTAFDVSLANPKYASVKGILCSKDGKTVIAGVNGDVKIPEGVTSIGNGAFRKYSGLISVEIPASVKNIGKEAFSNCMKLESVTMRGEKPDSGDKVFTKCDKLKSIHVPASCKSWAGMKEWQGIPLAFDADKVERLSATIDGYTWSYSVKNGEATIIPEGKDKCAVSPKPTGAFSIPGTLGGVKVTAIGRGAFSGCKGLTSVKIPEGVTSIGEGAFGDCTDLTSVSMPSSLMSLGDYAFGSCSGLKSVEIPASVRELKTQVFLGCTGLESVTIPAGVERIGWASFGYCNALKEIRVDEGNRCFTSVDGVLYTRDRTELVACPDTLSEISILPEVRNIGQCAFLGCYKLTNLTIPEGVTNIAWQGVKDCPAIKSVTIPSTVRSIGEIAFAGCGQLMSVSLRKSHCPVIQNDAFKGCGKLAEIRVPSDSLLWSKMKSEGKTVQGIPIVLDSALKK